MIRVARSMRRLSLILAAAATALMLAPATGSAVTPVTPKGRTCKLIGGKTLFSNSAMRIVRQRVKGGTRIVGCDRPSRKARRLGLSRTAGGVTSTATLLTARVHFAAVRQASVGPFGGGESTTVADVRAGGAYVVALWSFDDVVTPGVPLTSGTKARAVKLAADGRSAAILAVGTNTPSFDQRRTDVVAFSATGARRLLDSAPQGVIDARSLTISGGTVSWTKAGARQSAAL